MIITISHQSLLRGTPTNWEWQRIKWLRLVRHHRGQLCQDLRCTARAALQIISARFLSVELTDDSVLGQSKSWHFISCQLKKMIIVAEPSWAPLSPFRLCEQAKVAWLYLASAILSCCACKFLLLVWCSVRSEGQSADEGHLWAISNQQAQPSAKATTVLLQLLAQSYSSLAFTTTTHANWSDQSPYTRTAVLGLRMCQRYAHTDAPCTSQGHFDGGLVALVSALAPPGGSDSHYQVHRPPADRK